MRLEASDIDPRPEVLSVPVAWRNRSEEACRSHQGDDSGYEDHARADQGYSPARQTRPKDREHEKAREGECRHKPEQIQHLIPSSG